jgi:peptidoglycan/LPS O-acetylase OafA/YrhL
MFVYILIAVAAAKGLLHVDNAERYDWSALIPYLTLTQSWGLHGVIAWNRDTWSISAEMLAYLLMPVLLWPLRRAAWPALLMVLVLTICCAAGSAELAGRPFTLLVTQVTQLRVLPSFAFGLWLATHKEWLLSRVPARASVSGFWIGMVGLALCLGSGANAYAMLGCVWLLVASAYHCDLSGVATLSSWKPISDKGRLTYSIYLIHPLIGTIWLNAVGKHLLSHVPGGPWIALAIGAVMVFALSVLSYTFFEEPLRKRLGRPLFQVRDDRPGALA